MPVPPGGSADIHARPLAEELRRRLGQPVEVDNRGGAGGSIGAIATARSPADGYTLMLDPGSAIPTTPLVQTVPYTVDDFAPVAKLSRGPYALVVHPDLPARDLNDLLRFARERPGALNFGTAGPGTGTHLVGLSIWMRAGVTTTHVPFRGGGPLITALVSGHVHVATATLPSSIGMVREGRLRLLAYTAGGAPPGSPDAPTLRAAGVDLEAFQWHGLFAPRGLPAEILARLHTETNAALAAPDVARVLLSSGATPSNTTVEAFTTMLRAEIERWREVVRAADIRADG